MKELIDELTGASHYGWEYGCPVVDLSVAIALIKKHTENKTLAPNEPTDKMLSELMNGWIPVANSYMSENYKSMLSAITEGSGENG